MSEKQKEVGAIKSIVGQLVKTSYIQREIIEIEKRLKKQKEDSDDRGINIVKKCRYIRAFAYIAVGIYFREKKLILIDNSFIPLIWLFNSSPLICPHLIFLLFVFGFAWRHIFRSLLPLVVRRDKVYV